MMIESNHSIRIRSEIDRLGSDLVQQSQRAGRSAFLLAGVDEVGCGPLAGPVVAAAVILDPQNLIRGLKDSKKLKVSERVMFASRIKERALAFAIAEASHEEIDRVNILQATHLAMIRAVEALSMTPDEVWVDGNQPPKLALPTRTLIKGDDILPAIAAASILAKVTRDAFMEEMDERYPGYGFSQHKGYGTRVHMEALQNLGPCPIHRRSFAPVAAALAAMA